MTLAEYISLLLEAAENDPLSIEVVALSDDNDEYTPVITIGFGKDGKRRITVA